MHAVQQLFYYRKNLSTTEFNARGKKLVRCEFCRIAKPFCICQLKPNTTQQADCQAAFVLLMYDDEVLKPSNTGRLIADIIPDTFAFLWSRTQVDASLLQLLQDERWQPMVVFPEQYASAEQLVFTSAAHAVQVQPHKRPLFIMLDGTWREAKKMFRKSPYLNQFPVLSINVAQMAEQRSKLASTYQLRIAAVENQLATAEVAAKILQSHYGLQEQITGDILALWFEVFNHNYQHGVCQPNVGNPAAVENLRHYLATLEQPDD
jgi:DTW domain-containing protein